MKTSERATLGAPVDQHGPAASETRLTSRFLLVGSERSGSTMLRLMLDHHPQLSCLYESDFMVFYYDAARRGSLRSCQALYERDWHFAHSGLHFPSEAVNYHDVIDSFFEQRRRSSEKPIIGATVQHEFHLLPELVADARYVHLYRDGRPVAASILQMGWAGNLYHAARRWRRIMEGVADLRARIPADRWLDVAYEELLEDTASCLERICCFLGVPFSQKMLEYPMDSTYEAPDPSNAYRWRRKLTPREIYLIEMAAGDVLDKWGYPRMLPPARPAPLERATLRAHDRLARALFNCQRYGAYVVMGRKLLRMLGLRDSAFERRYAAINDALIK